MNREGKKEKEKSKSFFQNSSKKRKKDGKKKKLTQILTKIQLKEKPQSQKKIGRQTPVRKISGITRRKSPLRNQQITVMPDLLSNAILFSI